MAAIINDGHNPAAAVEAGVDKPKPKITTIIFDVDDTLYDVGTVSL